MPTRTVSYEGFIDQDVWERRSEAERQRLVEIQYEDMARTLARQILDERLAHVTMEGPTAARRAVRLTMSVKVKHQTAQHWLTAEEVSTAPGQSFRDQFATYAAQLSRRAVNREPDVRGLGPSGPGVPVEPLDGNDRRTATDIAIDWQSRQYVIPERRQILSGRTASQIIIDDPMLPSGSELTLGQYEAIHQQLRTVGYTIVPHRPGTVELPRVPVLPVTGCTCQRCEAARR